MKATKWIQPTLILNWPSLSTVCFLRVLTWLIFPFVDAVDEIDDSVC